MSPVAYMLGARVIEKHFTLTHTLKGTDHAFSLMPEGMRKLVRDLRARPGGARRRRQAAAASEEQALRKMGKMLVAARALEPGHVLAEGDVAARSPADGGLAPYELDELSRPNARRGPARDDPVTHDASCRSTSLAQRERRRGVTDPLFDLSGRVAVVTGGFGQLGQVYTDGLAAARHARRRLRRRGRARRRRRTSADYAAGRHRPDVDRGGDGRGRGRVGRPHLLVNNAALDSPPDAPPEEVGPFETYPEASFDEVMDVNVKGVVLCCQVFGAAMARAGRGSIVNVSSDLRAPVARAGPLRVSPPARARRSSSRSRTPSRSRRSSTSRATSRRTGRRPACA